MAKRVIYHWVEMRTVDVPDECPTNCYIDMAEWMHLEGIGEELIGKRTRDCEIVEVKRIGKIETVIKEVRLADLTDEERKELIEELKKLVEAK